MKRGYVLGLVIVVLIGLAVWAAIHFDWFQRPVKNGVKPPSVDERIDILRETNVALGYLENTKYAQAVPVLKKLNDALPDEPMLKRNLLIAQLQPGTNPDDSDVKLLTAFEEPILLAEELARQFGDDYLNTYLAGRAHAMRLSRTGAGDDAIRENSMSRAAAHYAAAAGKTADSPLPHFAAYVLLDKWGDPDNLSPEAFDAIRNAQARAQDNLVVQLEWLLVLNQKKDIQQRDVLDRLLRLIPEKLEPDVAPARQALVEAHKIAKDKGAEASDDIRRLINPVRAQLRKSYPPYQRDYAAVYPHLLEFVQHDLRPAFYEGLPADTDPPITVRFEPFDLANWNLPLEAKTLALAFEDLQGGDESTEIRLLTGTKPNTTRLEVKASKHTTFEPIEVPGNFSSFQLVDWDLDIKPVAGERNQPADLDVVLYGAEGVRVLENQESAPGKRRWVDRTDKANLPDLKSLKWLLVCDMDHDGNLDLIVGLEKGVRILRNTGDWSFDDITSRSPGLERLETIAAVWGDFDRDGDLDFMLLADTGSLVFLENARSGRFVPKELPGKIAVPLTLLAFDADNDGRLDLLIGHGNGATIFYAGEKQLPSLQSVLKTEFQSDIPIRKAGYWDFDNDGWLDLWLLKEQGEAPAVVIRRNSHTRQFSEGPALQMKVDGRPFPAAHQVLVTDFDGDGDRDLVVVGSTYVQGFRNDGGNQNHWLDIRLRALLNTSTDKGAGAKCNYYNIGGTLEVKSGLHYQFQQVTGPVTHFGLGKRTTVDIARAIWTNGVSQVVMQPKPDQVITEEQAPKGSCPYLYTWDGERWVFITDCLWTSALGMKLAHGVLMPHDRQHNHLIIPGDKVKPKDNKYRLSFTNELWEVPYVDQVQLWVIEHPDDVEVYTNQRVPPLPVEQFEFRTVRKRIYPKAARDHQGQDVLPLLKQRDGQCVGGFKRQRYVGFTELHGLELDLGDLSQAKKATLYLTGWIWPTDTTGNVAISQDPRYRGPQGVVGGAQPPALSVPDRKGGWQVALPNMGFMSGKLQTVAVDLPLDKFVGKDYRVRIDTQMELYWDEAFFTINELTAEIDVKKLPVAEATLQYRGYSRIHQATPSSPFLYDYHDVDRAPRWLPMPGPFTRFGRVEELLAALDSRYVLMSPGDELMLSFQALSPLAAGRKRTFLFYANGWLKDFDMNGEASDGVLPLPFEGMKRYPYLTADGPEATKLEAFRKEFLTREADANQFWDRLRPKGRRDD